MSEEKVYKIGIDVGGTNTDCVLVDKQNRIISKTKQRTTEDISSGIENALSVVIHASGINPKKVRYVMLGTTHCTNALVERKRLNKVGIVRICRPASVMIPPLMSFPEDLRKTVEQHIYMVKGGHEFDGRLIAAIDEDEITEVLGKMKGDIESIAITGIFSKINPDQELRVATLAKEVIGEELAISMSHQIGSLGLLERENATVLNAMLRDIAVKMTTSFQQAIEKHGIEGSLFIGQNDGTLMSVNMAKDFPVLTIACGPTNSIRGAGALSGIKNGIVLDVGGTTTDAGALVNQFPRESSKVANVGGVKTNFRMPDVVAIGLGGGTIIKSENEKVKIGPESVGYQITEMALSFRGDTFTLSDYAIARDRLEIKNSISKNELIESIEHYHQNRSATLLDDIASDIELKITHLIEKVKTDSEPLPVILVGGGSPILPDVINGASEIIRPEHYEVANAYGACISQISGEAEKVYNLNSISREDAIEEVKKVAISKAISAGAVPNSIEVLKIEDVPLAYLPNAIKIKVKVCGDLE